MASSNSNFSFSLYPDSDDDQPLTHSDNQLPKTDQYGRPIYTKDDFKDYFDNSYLVSNESSPVPGKITIDIADYNRLMNIVNRSQEVKQQLENLNLESSLSHANDKINELTIQINGLEENYRLLEEENNFLKFLLQQDYNTTYLIPNSVFKVPQVPPSKQTENANTLPSPANSNPIQKK